MVDGRVYAAKLYNAIFPRIYGLVANVENFLEGFHSGRFNGELNDIFSVSDILCDCLGNLGVNLRASIDAGRLSKEKVENYKAYRSYRQAL
jgi:hypothetical protein